MQLMHSMAQSSVLMMLELGPIPATDGRCDVDSPLSMSDCESLENICDYEEIYQHKANVEEIAVATMDKQRLPKVKHGNKSKPITKIFKDRTFSPSLEDIKEVEDKNEDTPYFLSLTHVHFDRAYNRGFLERDTGRNFRSEYWKSIQQQRSRLKKSSRRRTVSV